MRYHYFRRLAVQIAISVAIAAITPAAGAGLVEGVKVAASTVDNATDIQAIVPDGASATVLPPGTIQPPGSDELIKSRTATTEPIRLSPLAGNDLTAWSSARTLDEPANDNGGSH
jgi:hypothetical protein